jgi:hypothetical protein
MDEGPPIDLSNHRITLCYDYGRRIGWSDHWKLLPLRGLGRRGGGIRESVAFVIATVDIREIRREVWSDLCWVRPLMDDTMLRVTNPEPTGRRPGR